MVDNIIIINYLENRDLEGKGGKLVALFIDLKAVFESADRGTLIRTMRERGIRKRLIRRMEEILRETKNRIKIREEVGREFWTGR